MESKSHPFLLLRDLCFPNNCAGCNTVLKEGEEHLCSLCIDHLPKTYYWHSEENTVSAMFYGKALIEQACSFLYFTKGGHVQHMLHVLKYQNQPRLGNKLGALFGHELLASSYAGVDLVLPVPLHPFKKKRRGYNQCDGIAQGISEVLNCDFSTRALARIRANETQTKKGRYDRWINVKELFRVVQPQVLEHKNILLIDDVVTTGATLEACIHAILKVEGVKLSVATIACPSIV